MINGEIDIGETIKNNIEYWKKRCFELEEELQNQKEINKEEQKINGNLQKRITELEKENKTLKAINRGKSIRELGVSDLYGEKQ